MPLNETFRIHSITNTCLQDILVSPTKITFQVAGGFVRSWFSIASAPRCLRTLSLRSIMTTILHAPLAYKEGCCHQDSILYPFFYLYSHLYRSPLVSFKDSLYVVRKVEGIYSCIHLCRSLHSLLVRHDIWLFP